MTLSLSICRETRQRTGKCSIKFTTLSDSKNRRQESCAARPRTGAHKCNSQSSEGGIGLFISDRFVPFLRTVDLIVAERRELAMAGPHLTILHRFQETQVTGCTPGEEILLVSLNFAGRQVPLKLSLALRILIDYLARYRHIPQSASQIEAGIRSDPFYVGHGKSVHTSSRRTRRICRSVVRVYVQRFRSTLKIASLNTGLVLDPNSVLTSEATEGNEVLYRLKARVDWRHIPLE